MADSIALYSRSQFNIAFYTTHPELYRQTMQCFSELQASYKISDLVVGISQCDYRTLHNRTDISFDAAVLYGNTFGVLDTGKRSMSITQVLEQAADSTEQINELQNAIWETIARDYNGEALAGTSLLVGSRMSYPSKLVYCVCEHEPLSGNPFTPIILYTVIRSLIQTVRRFNQAVSEFDPKAQLRNIVFGLDLFFDKTKTNSAQIAQQCALGVVSMCSSYLPQYPIKASDVKKRLLVLEQTTKPRDFVSVVTASPPTVPAPVAPPTQPTFTMSSLIELLQGGATTNNQTNNNVTPSVSDLVKILQNVSTTPVTPSIPEIKPEPETPTNNTFKLPVIAPISELPPLNYDSLLQTQQTTSSTTPLFNNQVPQSPSPPLLTRPSRWV